jgi:hypothetical protein
MSETNSQSCLQALKGVTKQIKNQLNDKFPSGRSVLSPQENAKAAKQG